jgi:hypothetical protein
MLQRRDLPRNIGVAAGGRVDGAGAGPAGGRATGRLDSVPGA